MPEPATRETPVIAPHAWSRSFPATPANVREARRFLASVLSACPAADDAVLCLSELVTNSITHSRSHQPGGHLTVRAEIRGDHLRVEVEDEGGPWAQPVRRRDGQHGRGLLIVAQLADDWGRNGDSATGWTVWFQINLDHLPATAGPGHPEEGAAMTEPAPAALAQYDAERMRAMAAELTANGLTTHLTDSRASLDLTATLSPSGRREAELIIDEDGYAEIRYWNAHGTPPDKVTATALRALKAITAAAPDPGSPLT